MKIVFVGAVGRFPIGGHAWADLQYLLGLQALGHEVFYLEDCGAESWVYDWQNEQLTTDPAYPATYICDTLRPYRLRWAYRVGDNVVGASLAEMRDVLASTDLLLVRGSPIPQWRPEYDLPRRRAYVDVDPGFTQLGALPGSRSAFVTTIERCEQLFTIGRNVGSGPCLIPTLGRTWKVTVSPVYLPAWQVVEALDASHITSVLQWRSYREVEHEGRVYGNKDRTFPRFLDLPRRTGERFRLALTGGDASIFTKRGWDVTVGWKATKTPDRYQRFVQSSRAELAIAKHGYVAMRSGWVSDRSVCYLASGRPVLAQDTGLTHWLPTGEGLLVFDEMAGAVAAVDDLGHDYDRHRKAARHLAERCFSTQTVLPPMLEAAMEETV